MFNRLLKAVGLKPTPASPPPSAEPIRSTHPAPVEVTDASFAQVVLASDTLAVVDFWADWCQPCQVMSAYVQMLATDYADRLLVAALDTDENPTTPAHYNVLGLPTLLFVRNGQEVDRILGVVGYPAIKKRVENLLVASGTEIEQ
jgi:thioredoxin 1